MEEVENNLNMNNIDVNNNTSNNTSKTKAKKTSGRITQSDVEDAENTLNSRLLGVVGSGDEFRATYWPMEKWIDDYATAEMLSMMIETYPDLNWKNQPSVQFGAMLSVVQDVDWINTLRAKYEFGLVDFMRVVFMNWPELFTRKKYVSTLSTAIVSAFTQHGEL